MTDERTKIHDARITLRVSEDIGHRATEAARRQGMSLSEAIRQFLRELAEESCEDPERGQVILELVSLIFQGPAPIRDLEGPKKDRCDEMLRRLEEWIMNRKQMAARPGLQDREQA